MNNKSDEVGTITNYRLLKILNLNIKPTIYQLKHGCEYLGEIHNNAFRKNNKWNISKSTKKKASLCNDRHVYT